MNCKPNDLARVIDHPVTRLQGAVDKIVRVLSATPQGMWLLEQPLRCGCGCPGVLLAIHDSLLRPIGTPGDDEGDESKAWLPPVPKREEVPA